MRRRTEQGFMLPGVIIMSSAIFIIGLAVAQLVISNQQAIVRGMYEQVAQVAAKSGVDYAKDQFLATGAYAGTTEQSIVSNGKYRATFTVEVLSTSADGLEKKIQSTGRIYVPELSSSQLLVSSIKTEIVRTTSTAITPGEFSPLAWYDASDNPTLHPIASTTANWTDLNTDVTNYINERISNGTQTMGSWNQNWISFGYNPTLSSDTYTGVLFHLYGVPKNATINSAYIQFRSNGTTGAVSWININALAMSAIEPDGTFNPPNANNQVRNQPTIGPAVQWFALQWPVGGQAGPPQRTPDLKALVQATLDQPGYDPALHHIGFKLDRVLGIGNHRASKGQASLVVNYSVTNDTVMDDGELVATWDDKSGNGRHLRATGTEPTYRVNQQNGLPMVQFQSSKFMQSDLFSLPETADAGTVFVVGKSNASSGNNATLFRLFGNIPSEPNCVGGNPCTTRAYDFSRSGNGTNMTFFIERGGPGGTANQTASTPNIFNGAAAMLTGGVAFTPGSCKPNLNQSAIDIAHNSDFVSNCPGTSNNPKSFKDDLRISLANGKNGAIFNGDIGEVVVYDKQLSCHQVRSIQKYLRQKWFNDTSDTNVLSCPAPPIPSF